MEYRVLTEGMGCNHCVSRVTKAMEGLGARVVSMELNDFTVDFGGCPDDIKKAVETLGFKVKSVAER